MSEMAFSPALGRTGLNRAYDLAIRLLTRERTWRTALLDQVGPRDGDSIIDVGCGTGSFAIMLKRAAPQARIVGLDPDPDILAIAAAKAVAAGVEIEWRQGFAREAADQAERFDKAVSSLMFHQVPIGEKRAGTSAMFEAVRPGGTIHVADYCRQPDWLMRQLFRIIQAVDGRTNTQANLDGAVENTLATLAGRPVAPRSLVRTPTGAISLFRLSKDQGE